LLDKQGVAGSIPARPTRDLRPCRGAGGRIWGHNLHASTQCCRAPCADARAYGSNPRARFRSAKLFVHHPAREGGIGTIPTGRLARNDSQLVKVSTGPRRYPRAGHRPLRTRCCRRRVRPILRFPARSVPRRPPRRRLHDGVTSSLLRMCMDSQKTAVLCRDSSSKETPPKKGLQGSLCFALRCAKAHSP
jgi:hypothetical protein